MKKNGIFNMKHLEKIFEKISIQKQDDMFFNNENFH